MDAQAQERLSPIEGLEDRPWADEPLVVIDFETSGLDPMKDRVVEYGVAKFEHGVCVAMLGCLVDPCCRLSDEVQKIHGITNEQLKGKLRFEQVLPQLATLLRGSIPVAYNAPFDRNFLLAEVSRAVPPNTEAPFYMPQAFSSRVEWIDPLVWVRELRKYDKGKKLTDVAPRLGVKLEDAHRATADAKATGEVLLKLAPKMPRLYGQLIEEQQRLALKQQVEFARWRARRSG